MKPTICCVHDLVKHPCTNLEDCDEEIGSVVRALLQEGKLCDSGARRNGRILWITPDTPFSPRMKISKDTQRRPWTTNCELHLSASSPFCTPFLSTSSRFSRWS